MRVTLRGSQFASTTTNRDGRYRFANLPTSGIYNVTAAKEQYTFPSLTFDTPSGDQRGDLRGARSRSGFAGK